MNMAISGTMTAFSTPRPKVASTWPLVRKKSYS
jgi:hypothetical protein